MLFAVAWAAAWLHIASATPLACLPNDLYPMVPTYHIIGNVTPTAQGIALEPINDASGVTYWKGIYHIWHQCVRFLFLECRLVSQLPVLAQF